MNQKIHYSKSKPKTCPNCGSEKIADILWGYPGYSEEMEKQIEEGKLVLGGCCVTDHDPEWECVECETSIFRISQ